MSLGHLTGSFMSGLLLSQFIFNVSLYIVWVQEWLSCSNDSSFYIKYKIEKNIKLSNGVKNLFYFLSSHSKLTFLYILEYIYKCYEWNVRFFICNEELYIMTHMNNLEN